MGACVCVRIYVRIREENPPKESLSRSFDVFRSTGDSSEVRGEAFAGLRWSSYKDGESGKFDEDEKDEGAAGVGAFAKDTFGTDGGGEDGSTIGRAFGVGGDRYSSRCGV